MESEKKHEGEEENFISAACIICTSKDSDWQASFRLKKRALNAQSLGCPFLDMIYISRQIQLCIKGHPKVRGWVDPLVWISK